MTDADEGKGLARPATLKDIARALKVDISTVSKVLTGGISVKPETRRAILDEAQRLNYRPHALARNLRTRRSGALGILLPNLMNPVYAAIVRGAVHRAEELGYVMLVADVDDEATSTSVYLKLVSERRIDAMIIAVSTQSPEFVSAIENNPIPHLFVNRRSKIGGHSVTVDDFAAGYLAAKTFAEYGHTRLAFIGASDELDTAQRRRAGFLKGVREAGLPPFIDAVGPYSRRGGYESMTSLIEAKWGVTGIFASNLLVGIGALAAALARKVNVPAEMSIITLDAEDAVYTSPPLTAIQTSLEEMGARSVDEVDAMFRGQEPSDVVIETPPTLIVRGSLAPPPKG